MSVSGHAAGVASPASSDASSDAFVILAGQPVPTVPPGTAVHFDTPFNVFDIATAPLHTEDIYNVKVRIISDARGSYWGLPLPPPRASFRKWHAVTAAGPLLEAIAVELETGWFHNAQEPPNSPARLRKLANQVWPLMIVLSEPSLLFPLRLANLIFPKISLRG